MKEVLLEAGIQVFEATEARKIEGHTVVTHAGSVSAEKIIIAIDKMEPQFSRFSNETYHAQTFLSVSEPLSLYVLSEISASPTLDDQLAQIQKKYPGTKWAC